MTAAALALWGVALVILALQVWVVRGVGEDPRRDPGVLISVVGVAGALWAVALTFTG